MGFFKVIDGIEIFIISHKKIFFKVTVVENLFYCPRVPGTAENARRVSELIFSDLHETLCRQEREMALSVDAHVRKN